MKRRLLKVILSLQNIFGTYFILKQNHLYCQISNPALIDLIRRKVKLNQPYVGIFLRKKEEDKSDIVSNLDDVHSVGVFAQIHEMQDMDYKLRLVVMAHRRIKITGQFIEDEIETGPAGKFA